MSEAKRPDLTTKNRSDPEGVEYPLVIRPLQGRNVSLQSTWGAARDRSLYPTLFNLSPSGTDVGPFVDYGRGAARYRSTPRH